MLSLLLLLLVAQADLPRASFFEHDGVKGGLLFLFFAFMAWIAKGLAGLQAFRKNATAEITMQQREDKRAEDASRIPQPLEIKAHVGFTPLDKHNALAKQLDELKEQRRKDVSGLHIKIENGIDGLRKELSAEFAGARTEAGKQREDIVRLQAETTHQTRQLSSLDGKMDQVLLRLQRPPNP